MRSPYRARLGSRSTWSETVPEGGQRRPSVRVESLGDWGAGAIRLFQLPAHNEYNDNVVAFWQPQSAPAAGDQLVFKYRLRWFSDESNKP